ncbi:Hsp20/alpha crystallin family protein [Agromyces sp. H3Y2-19a]|uniref:Hsp20/alpha crystallin family protein n=1 Tax=Agromyces chromiiresistens TaxID=3030835 RepID=UPI0023B90D41|nr:Hsp20/alpha crystallin family protein [Agromyces chromiiresistens]MDF0515613.1 Hsp20/alpha crystallin family protein [Agromyces chromiiresistens]
MNRDLARVNPFAELDALSRSLFEDGLTRTLRGKTPSTDVYTEDDKALILEAHLPNFDEKDISVTVDRGTLVVQAERRETEEDKKKKYVVRETSSSFYRSIALPDRVDDSKITAKFDKGVLKVTIPLTDSSSERKIAIESEK